MELKRNASNTNKKKTKIASNISGKQNYHGGRQAHNDYVRNMVSNEKRTSSKKLYLFIKCKKCNKSRVAPLKNDEKNLHMHYRTLRF